MIKGQLLAHDIIMAYPNGISFKGTVRPVVLINRNIPSFTLKL